MYILVYSVYTSISVLKRILGATITTHNSLLYVYYMSICNMPMNE